MLETRYTSIEDSISNDHIYCMRDKSYTQNLESNHFKDTYSKSSK